MTSPWSDNEDLTAALMYARTTALIVPLQAATADIGYISTTIVTAANGSTITSQKGRVTGNEAWLRVIYTIGSAAVTALGSVGTTGALTNTDVLNITDTRFQTLSSFPNQTLPSSSAGRSAIHIVVTSSNTIQLSSVAGSAAIAAGNTFSLFGKYLLD